LLLQGHIGFSINPYSPSWPQQRKSDRKKFTCSQCGLNAWAKPGALPICGECFDEGEGDICFMLAEQEV